MRKALSGVPCRLLLAYLYACMIVINMNEWVKEEDKGMFAK
jgi:L-asparagine transporter-like permease